MDKVKINQQELYILHFNISSLISHINNLKTLTSLITTKIDIICISERRLSQNMLLTANIDIS